MRESLLERKLAQQGRIEVNFSSLISGILFFQVFQCLKMLYDLNPNNKEKVVEGLGARLGLVVRLASLAGSFGGASLR
jgi:hypothetical protein